MATLKSLVKRSLPAGIIFAVKKLRRGIEHRRNAGQSSQDVFSQIYSGNTWGGRTGEFFSGDGTGDDQIANPYVEKIRSTIFEADLIGRRFVDLGCGDFRIGRVIQDLASEYYGVDVVPDLIRRNRAAFASDSVRFYCLDLTTDELPDGDVAFIRQVLQHLSNGQIQKILNKCRHKYSVIFVTEHLPRDENIVARNVDKPQGSDIRLFDGSGVYLTHPPFSVPPTELTQILEVEGSGFSKGKDPGVIRTYMWKPSPDLSGGR